MNVDIDLAKLTGWIVASLAGILMFFFKRELSSIDSKLDHIEKKLELTERDMEHSLKKLETDVITNKGNITLNSVRDEEFKKFLDEKFDRLFNEIEHLKNKK